MDIIKVNELDDTTLDALYLVIREEQSRRRSKRKNEIKEELKELAREYEDITDEQVYITINGCIHYRSIN